MTIEKRKSGKKREFTTVPARAIGDVRLTALELRCLMVISLHDGMSLQRGTGAGCYARYSTLAELVQTDITNFSKAVSRLLSFGYVVRDKQATDKRRYTLRVVPDPMFEKVGDTANYIDKQVGGQTNHSAEIVGERSLENDAIPPKPSPEYISLNEEIDFDESREIDSLERAQLADREMRRDDVPSAIQALVKSVRKDTAEAGLSEEGRASIKAHLPPSWEGLSTEAQLSHFERAFKKVGCSAGNLPRAERQELEAWLFSVSDISAGEPVGYRAERLLIEMET